MTRVTSPASQRGLDRWLLSPWFYPLVAGVMAAALVAATRARPSLFAIWLLAGVAVAAALGRLLALRELALWSMSSTDAATGLMNRRQFQQALERELAQMFRSRQPIALLLFDLDGLKKLNDRLGHATGDEALKAVAHAFKRFCRAGDLVARWGGDEFAVVANCADEHEARALGARLCLAVREASEGALVLSVSGGIALADPDRPSVSRPSALFSAADRALYRAKGRGGNRVELASAEVHRLKLADASDVQLVRPDRAHARDLKRWPT